MKKDQKVEASQKEGELIEQLQRLQAEFTNYRTRVEKEKLELSLRAREAILLKFLDIKDNFDRAPKLDKGMEMIYKQFLKIFEEEQIKGVENERFNPEFHEAIATDPSTEQGKIADVLQEGYLHGDRLIRPSKVVVGAKTTDKQGEQKNE